MERKRNRLLRCLLYISLFLLTAYALALLGYTLMRKNAPQEQTRGAYPSSDSVPAEDSTPPGHMPVAIQTVLPEETDFPAPPEDNNDYLILAEGDSVSLYILTENGETVYSGDLYIPLSALMPEDRQQLTEGVILDTKEEVSYLIEDFSS